MKKKDNCGIIAIDSRASVNGVAGIMLAVPLFFGDGDVMGVVSEVITEIGQTAVIVAGASWLAKSIFSSWLTKNVESHKFELNKSVEHYKSEIQRELQLHQIRNSKLHNDRSEIIKELFSYVTKVTYETGRLGNGNVYSMSDVKEVDEILASFATYYAGVSIYFEQEILETIEEMLLLSATILLEVSDLSAVNTTKVDEILSDIRNSRKVLQKKLSNLLGVQNIL